MLVHFYHSVIRISKKVSQYPSLSRVLTLNICQFLTKYFKKFLGVSSQQKSFLVSLDIQKSVLVSLNILKMFLVSLNIKKSFQVNIQKSFLVALNILKKILGKYSKKSLGISKYFKKVSRGIISRVLTLKRDSRMEYLKKLLSLVLLHSHD